MPQEQSQQQSQQQTPSLADRLSNLTALKSPLQSSQQTTTPAVQAPPSEGQSSFADRIYNLLAGKSTVENPNAGDFSGPELDDRKKMAGILFAEISNRTSDKQELEAQTILNTARNRSKAHGTSVIEELTKPHQYQGYESGEYNRFISGGTRDTDKQKTDAINKIIDQLEAGTLENNIDDYQFYVHKPDGSISATRDYIYGKKKDTGQ